MAKQKEIKTNAMRILEKKKIAFKHYTYECEEFIDGAQTADLLGLEHKMVFKTLVTLGADKNYYVFVIPIDEELDLKKAAKSVGVKSVSMIQVKDIQMVTGYIRGGCTAIGMKKQYRTVISDFAKGLEYMIVSGGRIGSQIELTPQDLCEACQGEFGEITEGICDM